jgi:hypothetical protein
VQQTEVAFKGKSGTMVVHTSTDGSVNVNLEAGNYEVTISALGFATTNLAVFSVPGPTVQPFRVILKARPPDLQPIMDASSHIGVPTVPSELPDIIQDEPTRTLSPVVQPVTTKRRSIRCLYLWRCSAS